MASETIQTIARLTPLAEVLALIDREVKPVAPCGVPLNDAINCILAADVLASAQPAAPLALVDGWALSADLTRDAGSYAPAPLQQMPVRIEAGRRMPDGTDSVAAFDMVKLTQGGAEALAPVNPGDGVLPAGGDCDVSVPMRRAGERLRVIDLAALACAGASEVNARRPRLRIVPVRADTIIANAARLIATDAARCGGAPDEAQWRLERSIFGRRARTPSSPSAAPAAAATTPACRRWRARDGSSCMASRSRRARLPRSALSGRDRCCCCRAVSMPRWRYG